MSSQIISVITVNYNNSVGLEATINSVLIQNYPAIQYIIVDGGSDDNSKEVINKYTYKINSFLSEKDNGIYHAMNKGIGLATGDYLIFLNSGDIFFNENVLSKLINEGEGADIIYGNLLVVGNEVRELRTFPSKLSFSYFLQASLPHPATLIKKELFKSAGKYSEDLIIVSDWAFFVTAIVKSNCSYCYVAETITIFDMYGISSHEKNLKLIETERSIFLNSNFPLYLDDYTMLEKLKSELKRSRQQVGYRIYSKFQKLLRANTPKD